MVSLYHQLMAMAYKDADTQLPVNRDLPNDVYRDKIFRELDCSVIEYMHDQMHMQAQKDILEKGFTEYPIFDSTRGVFTEGGPAFEGAGIFEKSHIQLCIRNPNCIKGFFLPRKETNFTTHLHALKPDGVFS